MKTTKFFSFLFVLLATALLTGCPVDEKDLFTGVIRVTNNDPVANVTEIYISNACGSGWGSATNVTLTPGLSASYDGYAVDSWDVKAFFDDNSQSATITVDVPAAGIADASVTSGFGALPLTC